MAHSFLQFRFEFSYESKDPLLLGTSCKGVKDVLDYNSKENAFEWEKQQKWCQKIFTNEKSSKTDTLSENNS